MAVFVYQAFDGRQGSQCGTIAADSPRQARDLLRARGLLVQSIAEHGSAAKTAFGIRQGSGKHAVKLTTGIREIATLLGAGIPLVEALRTAGEQQKGSFRSSLLLLRERVSAGIGLAEAMAEQPDVFDPLCVHMAEVGENAGTLETVLDQWADFKDRALMLKDRVTTAMTYPMFVLVVGVAVTLFLMTYVIPMLLENLLEAGRPLPLPTRIVKGMSDLLLGYGWISAIGAGAAIAAIVIGVRSRSGKRAWHRLVLKLPLIGSMARRQAVSRMAMIIATLMKSGVDFLRALDVTGRSIENVLLRDALAQVGKDVGAGQKIGKSLARTGIFPPLAVQIFAVGQESGRLEEMLERLAADYDRQVARASERLTAALEPVLILSLALFVGFILLATILPILEAGNVS